MERLRKRFNEVPGVETFVTEVPNVGGQRGEPLQFVLTGLVLERVAELAAKLKTRLGEVPDMGTLDLDLQLD
jgi:HAE1 family hydrophobic/amphiphilic exporter-1